MTYKKFSKAMVIVYCLAMSAMQGLIWYGVATDIVTHGQFVDLMRMYQ